MPGLSADALRQMKADGRRIAMLTGYDCPTAQFVEAAGADLLLVGDTLAMVVLGFRDTHAMTMDIMLVHVGAARRGAPNTHVIADMPIHSYDTPEQAVTNARRFIEAGADSVKVEGAIPEIIRALREAGVEAMGHVGLTPQTATNTKARGRDPEEAAAIRQGARVLEQAGCYAVVLEHMPLGLAQQITADLAIPTIGIGAGPHCDGQVLVIHDLLGVFERFKPPFVKRYADLGKLAKDACRRYVDDVRAGAFPDLDHSTR